MRLAEDLATVDVLSGGRLQPGFSTGMPHPELLADLVHDGDWRSYELGYERIERVRRALSGVYLGDPDTRIESPGNVQRPRVQPYSPGLIDRLWYGGTSSRSVSWSAQHGYHVLTGNITSGDGSTDFVAAQRDDRALPRGRRHRPTRVGLGRVILPTDSASAATRDRYRRYVESRTERTRTAHGPRGILFAPDVIGSADQIVETLSRDAAYDVTDELRLEPPTSSTSRTTGRSSSTSWRTSPRSWVGARRWPRSTRDAEGSVRRLNDCQSYSRRTPIGVRGPGYREDHADQTRERRNRRTRH